MKQIAVLAVLLLLGLAFAEADPGNPQGPKDKPWPKTKRVKCKDKYSPCYKQDLYCPTSCPKSCYADCNSCQAVCDNAAYTPPPTTPYTPPPPPATPPPPTTPYTPPPPPATPPPPTTPYTPPPPPATPPSPSSGVAAKHARCRNKNYPSCYYRQHTCPASCPDSCQVDCVTCSPVCDCNRPGAVCQDPRFVGADGLAFYFHGKKDQDFCIVADHNLHINAHFIGKRNANMGRDFTWVQSLGILFDDHKLQVGALKTSTWNDANDRLSLFFDGQQIDLKQTDGAQWQSAEGSKVTITRSKATNAVEIEAEGKFKIKAVVVPITEKDSVIHNYGITTEDCFAHLDLSFKFYSLSGEVDGVLGQTYANNYVSRVKVGALMPVIGGLKEFHSSNIFSTDCAVAKFTSMQGSRSSQELNYADFDCKSAVSGSGIICKR